MVENRTNMDEAKLNATIQEVSTYVTNPENVVDAEDGRVCGDGRYFSEQSKGMLARFGADFGYVLGLLALNRRHKLGLTWEGIVNSVVEASNEVGGGFFAHTDDHTEPDEKPASQSNSIGCAHAAKAALPENESEYEVVSTDVQAAINHTKELAKSDPEHVRIVKLKGPHLEKGVVVNMGVGKTMAHRAQEQQFFMVDMKRDKDYIEQKLFSALLVTIPILKKKDIKVHEFEEVLEKQTNATAAKAAKGLPKFEVNADEETPRVQQVGVI